MSKTLTLPFWRLSSLVPKLLLDNKIKFVRAETEQTATYVDSSGYVVLSDIGSPRINYSPFTLMCRGLLIEEARTNLVINNNDATGRIFGSGSVILNNGVSPSGASDADLVTNNAGSGTVDYSVTVAASSTNDYFVSIFMKPMSSQPWVVLNAYYSGNSEDNVSFTFSNMNISGAPYPNDVIFEQYINGWYRIGFRVTRDASGSKTILTMRLWVDGRGNTNTKSCLVWGAQIESGTFISSVIPTLGVSKTRSAELVSITGTDFTSWYNQTEGTIAVYGYGYNGSFPVIFNISETNANNNNSHNVNIGASSNFIFSTYSGGSEIHNNQASFGNNNSPWCIVSGIKTNDFSDLVCENAVKTDSAGTLPSVMTRLDIGSKQGLNFLNGNISEIVYYNTKLSYPEMRILAVQRIY